MIVKPRKKVRPLKENELRVITIGEKALEELLWEHLMEHLETYFDVDPVSETEICTMDYDRKSGTLTYAILPISYVRDGKQLDFHALRRKTGITSTSLFQKGRYRRVKLSQELFVEN